MRDRVKLREEVAGLHDGSGDYVRIPEGTVGEVVERRGGERFTVDVEVTYQGDTYLLPDLVSVQYQRLDTPEARHDALDALASATAELAAIRARERAAYLRLVQAMRSAREAGSTLDQIAVVAKISRARVHKVLSEDRP